MHIEAAKMLSFRGIYEGTWMGKLKWSTCKPLVCGGYTLKVNLDFQGYKIDT